MRYCFDTGYFVKYASGQLSQKHRRALREIADGTALGFACGLVIYELKKLGLRGVIEMEDAEWIAATVEEACEVERTLSNEYVDQAARLSHGNDLSMTDAMMLTTALRQNADILYTSDSDLLKYDGDLRIEKI